MKGIKKFARESSPGIIGDAIVSIVNNSLYRQRHGGKYNAWRRFYESNWRASAESLASIQETRLQEFLGHCRARSPYFRTLLEGVDLEQFSVADMIELPVLEKNTLLEELDEITTIKRRNALVQSTGGTTGNSMEVFFDVEDMQERFAFIDVFRSKFGYSLGEKILWCTGKEIIARADQTFGRFYKHDYLNNIRFLSTFHLTEDTFPRYWKAIRSFSPKYILGFPSFVSDLCRYAEDSGLTLGGVRAFFPTAETVTDLHRTAVRRVFGCATIDQYASSEGAPFIIQCHLGRYHIQPHTGVFEIVDEDVRPSDSGEMLVTSFSTRGTPLIRYRIGDCATLAGADASCDCGFGGQLVSTIDGRMDDTLVTPAGSKISAANFSNIVKQTKGILKFQVRHVANDVMEVFVVPGETFDSRQEQNLVAAFEERVGRDMQVVVKRVGNIANESSGKFLMVKRLY